MNTFEQKNQSNCFQPLIKTNFLLNSDTLIVVKRGGGEREITPNKWWINRRTPVGEDVELFERMPYGGRRHIDKSKIIAVKRFSHNVLVEHKFKNKSL